MLCCQDLKDATSANSPGTVMDGNNVYRLEPLTRLYLFADTPCAGLRKFSSSIVNESGDSPTSGMDTEPKC